MTTPPQPSSPNDLLVRLVRIARGLEGGGYYNAAKVCWAAVDSALVRASRQAGIPAGDAELDRELASLITSLAGSGVKPALIAALHTGRKAVRERLAITAADIPTVFVCRVCGELLFGAAPESCPACGADGLTLREHPAVYYLEALPPEVALAALAGGPALVDQAIEGLSEAQSVARPASEGWSLSEALTHLLMAQGLLAGRIEKMLAEDNPSLRGLPPWELGSGGASTTRELAERFRGSRHATVSRLQGIAAADWWRTARHEEFGPVTILQQASYFAKHERAHIAQIHAIRQAVGG